MEKLGNIFGFLLFFACVGGWFANIFKLAFIVGGNESGMMALRIIGVFIPPLGVVLGYI